MKEETDYGYIYACRLEPGDTFMYDRTRVSCLRVEQGPTQATITVSMRYYASVISRTWARKRLVYRVAKADAEIAKHSAYSHVRARDMIREYSEWQAELIGHASR